MRWLRPSLAVAVAVLMIAVTAWADYNVQDKGSYFSGAQGQRVNSTGSALTQEVDPPMDANLTYTSIISRTLAAGEGDSSAVLNTGRMRLGMLLIKATPQSVAATESTAVIRLAVQIRTHLQEASDSNSVFAIYQYGRSDLGAVAAASQIDTSMAGQITNAVNLAASANSAFSGEFVVAVAVNRMGPGAGAIPSWTREWRWPNGIAIPLQSLFGRDLYSPYTSIRIRNLGNAGAANRSVAVTAHLIGTPL